MALSKPEVGVEPLFCLVFWDRGRVCARLLALRAGEAASIPGSSALGCAPVCKLRPPARWHTVWDSALDTIVDIHTICLPVDVPASFGGALSALRTQCNYLGVRPQ